MKPIDPETVAELAAVLSGLRNGESTSNSCSVKARSDAFVSNGGRKSLKSNSEESSLVSKSSASGPKLTSLNLVESLLES